MKNTGFFSQSSFTSVMVSIGCYLKRFIGQGEWMYRKPKDLTVIFSILFFLLFSFCHFYLLIISSKRIIDHPKGKTLPLHLNLIRHQGRSKEDQLIRALAGSDPFILALAGSGVKLVLVTFYQRVDLFQWVSRKR